MNALPITFPAQYAPFRTRHNARSAHPFQKLAVGRKGLASVWTALTFFIPNATPAATSATGIAAHYPHDKNIASDPAVIFADDFESYTSPSQLTNKWDDAYQLRYTRIATETGHIFAGRKALEFSLPISTTEVANALTKRLSPEQDTVFLRAYTKFDEGYSVRGSNHDGLRLSANFRRAGIKAPADGTGFFLFLVQNNVLGTPLPGESAPGYSHIYAYWPKQRSPYGDHWYPDGMVKPYSNTIGIEGDWLAYPNQYPDFRPMPNFLPQRNRWYCYELMVRANTPGRSDGEVKYWIDGKLVSDFPDLNIRSINTLKMDEAHISLQSLHSERVNKKWYDNVVIAKQYIGPMSTASAISAPTARLQNLSSRLLIESGENVGIAGFVIEGPEPKKLLIRGLGPTLKQFGLTGVMQRPTLQLYDASGSLITTNGGWKNTQQAAIAATQLAPPSDSEAAILATLEPGSYTVIQAGAGGDTGAGLLEVYDVDPLATSSLINISTRGVVQPGNGALIAGFLLAGGSSPTDVVVRALGPSLVPLGVKGALPDPILTLYDSNGNVLSVNDNWKASQEAALENTGLQPPNDVDAAIFTTLASGNYTAVVTGKNGNTGIASLEVYPTD